MFPAAVHFRLFLEPVCGACMALGHAAAETTYHMLLGQRARECRANASPSEPERVRGCLLEAVGHMALAGEVPCECRS